MKNAIITILALGLGVSLYFNYKDSRKFKVEPGKDMLEITYYGTNKVKDSIARASGGFGVAEKITTTTNPMYVCEDGIYGPTPCTNVKNPQPPPSTIIDPRHISEFINIYMASIRVIHEGQYKNTH
ncbi:MAG: hypothetical protein ABIX01_18225 [Chitinophagaceae bacterium]